VEKVVDGVDELVELVGGVSLKQCKEEKGKLKKEGK
jgi:hypothetical protein